MLDDITDGGRCAQDGPDPLGWIRPTATVSPRISISLLPALSDERLVSLASKGHERAFETFVQRYRAALLVYCRRMGLSEWRAEEVLQQALLQVWLALSSGTEVRDPKPWLYRIVHNGAVNAMRRTSEDHAALTR